MQRTWCQLLPFAAVALGCEPPDTALVHGCASSGLSLSTDCYVRAKRLEQDQQASFATHTKNEHVRVKVTVRVQRGVLTIELPGCTKTSGVASPGKPLQLECDAKINRHRYDLSLWARPKTLPVEGVEGEVVFRPI